jgi:hypothetical protein
MLISAASLRAAHRLHMRVHMKPMSSLFFLVVASMPVLACSTPSLSPDAAKVVASRRPPPPECETVKYIVGEGGGTFGGGWVKNEDLIEYAMNDLRNKAADIGANYVEHDPPQLGSGKGTTTTVTISGTAYRCKRA